MLSQFAQPLQLFLNGHIPGQFSQWVGVARRLYSVFSDALQQLTGMAQTDEVALTQNNEFLRYFGTRLGGEFLTHPRQRRGRIDHKHIFVHELCDRLVLMKGAAIGPGKQLHQSMAIDQPQGMFLLQNYYALKLRLGEKAFAQLLEFGIRAAGLRLMAQALRCLVVSRLFLLTNGESAVAYQVAPRVCQAKSPDNR